MDVKLRIGYLPDTPPLYPELTVKSYLHFVAEIKDVPWRDRKSRVWQVMKDTRLDDHADRLIGHLSRGYQQRVGIAQALVHNPKVLILDEPTVGLDPNQIREVRELIKELGKQRTIILSTHILPEVSMTCERIIVINQGRIVANGTEEQLKKTFEGAGTYSLAVKAPKAQMEELLPKIAGVKSVHFSHTFDEIQHFELKTIEGKEIREELFSALSQQKWPIYELKPPGVTLEDVFFRLTREQTEAA
jgi:ABC-2 type transport system ATP-binding protein